MFKLKRNVDALGGRIERYKSALLLFRQHPIVGIGMGNFRNYTGNIHTHSIFFQVFTETGLAGMAGMIFLLGKLIKHLARTVRECTESYRYIITGAVASLICFFMNNILDFTLGHGTAIQSGIILAIVDAPHFQSKYIKV